MTQSRMLTLAQWSDISGIPSTPSIKLDPDTPHIEGTVSVIINHTDYPRRQGLWFLSDYIVTSSDGTIVWLAPHKQPEDSNPPKTSRDSDTLKRIAKEVKNINKIMNHPNQQKIINNIATILRDAGIHTF